TILGGRVIGALDKSKVKQAQTQMVELQKALDMYYMDCSIYPTTDEGLDALLSAPASCPSWGPEPYAKKNLLKDPWNTDFVYDSDGGTFSLMSLGKDRREGGEGYNADITLE